MSELPAGWKRAPLGEIAHISSGGTPRRKRWCGSFAAFSKPHFSSENGGLATTTSNRRSLPSGSSSLGLRRVSPHSMRWLSSACRNMFILASAHVLPIASCP